MQSLLKPVWRSPEEIVEIAFQRASVVMMNEAHSDWKRCIRTREIGKRILPVAHQAGARHLAMEALFSQFAEECNKTRRLMSGDWGYLSQPEMKDFIQTALDLGWTLIPYEADGIKWLLDRHGIDLYNELNPEKHRRVRQQFESEFMSLEHTNWREEQQALNILTAVRALPPDAPLLVWCGNSHHSKKGWREWVSMGIQFQEHSGINPFVIDQTRTVQFSDDQYRARLVQKYADELAKHDGTAGFLREEAPWSSRQNTDADAFVFSMQNELE